LTPKVNHLAARTRFGKKQPQRTRTTLGDGSLNEEICRIQIKKSIVIPHPLEEGGSEDNTHGGL